MIFQKNTWAIFRYYRQSGKFTFGVIFALFPGNFGYLKGSKMEYVSIKNMI